MLDDPPPEPPLSSPPPRLAPPTKAMTAAPPAATPATVPVSKPPSVSEVHCSSSGVQSTGTGSPQLNNNRVQKPDSNQRRSIFKLD